MHLIETAQVLAYNVNGFAFMVGSMISLVIYHECRKCIREIERKDMLDKFLQP